MLEVGVGFILFGLFIVVIRLKADRSRRRWAMVRALLFAGLGAALVMGSWSKVFGGLILLLDLVGAIVVILAYFLRFRSGDAT